MMKFIREIPTERIVNKDLTLDQFGFILIWREDSLEIWAEVN